jgi:Fic family protein
MSTKQKDDLELAVMESNLIERVPNEGLWFDNHLRAAQLCQERATVKRLVNLQILHIILFQNLGHCLPGKHEPGDYRSVDVQVGTFTPARAGQVVGLMDGWIHHASEFIRGNNPMLTPWDFHAYFETIHPFPDGNGRVGRLLYWNLQMLIGEPIEIIYFAEKDAYYDRLEEWRLAHKGWGG